MGRAVTFNEEGGGLRVTDFCSIFHSSSSSFLLVHFWKHAVFPSIERVEFPSRTFSIFRQSPLLLDPLGRHFKDFSSPPYLVSTGSRSSRRRI